MKILITGGSGFIGKNLIDFLLKNNHEVTVLTRNKKKINNLKVFTIKSLEEISNEQKFDVIINLAGASISKRWTKSYKKELILSRITITEKIISLVERLINKPELLISASAIGYYGAQKEGNILNEESKPIKDFTHCLCQKWEDTAKKIENYGVRICIARLGIVLGKNGGALEKMLPSFKIGLGAVIGNGKQVMSWIHIDDVVRIFNLFIKNKKLNGAYNLTSPYSVSNYEFSKLLAKKLNKNVIFHLPSILIKLLFGEMGEILLLKGNTVTPKKILEEGYVFQYPKIDNALSNILDKT